MLNDDNIKIMNRFYGKKFMYFSEFKFYISFFFFKNIKVIKNINLYKINFLDCVFV